MDEEAGPSPILRDEAYYTSADLERLLKVCGRTIENWCAAGKLKPTKLSARCYRFLGADVRAFLERARGAGEVSA